MKKKRTAHSAFLNLRAVLTVLVCAAACSIVAGTLLAFFRSEAPSTASERTLTFAERVAYQRAIEEVYWRHRIWPKERPDPKPSLDVVMSQAQIENKVTDYLRKSQALDEYWQRPITAEQLQAEMDRIAQHTRQPEVLHELFDALGNDPFVIAECLARPALAERLTADLSAPSGTPSPSATPVVITVTNTNDSGPGSLRQALADANDGDTIGFAVTGTIGLTSGELLVSHSITISGPGSENLAVNGNAKITVFHIAPGETVTISGLTITNGHASDSGAGIYNDHAVLILSNCVITGNLAAGNMGGGIHNDGKNIGHATLQINNSLITNNSGGIYNDALQAGTATLVITYSTLSNNNNGDAINNDGWSCTFCGNGTTSVQITNSSITGNPGRAIYSDTGRANCGGSCPITVSITNSTISGNGGGVYNSTLSDTVVSNSTISDNGSGIYNDGGSNGADVSNSTMSNNGVELSNDGPSTLSMQNTIFNVSPGGHSIVSNFGPVHSSGYNLSSDDGGGYLNGPGDQINTDPLLGLLQDNGGPTFTHALLPGSPAINAGDPNFPPGGYDQRGPGFDRVRNGRIDVGSFEVQEPSPTPTATPTASPTATPTPTATPSPTAGCTDDTWTATSIQPLSRFYHTAVWTGSEMIIWGGSRGGSPFNTGARYTPSTDTWTATSQTNVPEARTLHTAVWTGSEMIIWGGIAGSTYYNSGGRYNPMSNTWSSTTSTNAPSARWAHTAVWAGSEMIVWGGYSLPGGDVNTGGSYNPIADSWTPTTTTNAPDGREGPTSVWTGNEMIVWGGTVQNGITVLNTGGRYNPSTNSWTATSLTNAPDARRFHTAVWSGNEMVVWGGTGENFHALDTGGRYNLTRNSWRATSLVNAPTAREGHTAVWTDGEMIIWGGNSSGTTGGRYDPGTDAWRATSTISAPAGRDYHTAVWTGSEMIVWGGRDDQGNSLATGGRYCAQFSSPTPSPTPTATATPSGTPTSTPTGTPRPTPTPRFNPTPRSRPTPPPRP
jgi:N-acetylneuraminic acid mutarotase